MVEVETGSTLVYNSEDGDFGPDYFQYTWHMEIGDTQLLQFKRIEVTVTNKLFISRGTYKLVLYKEVGT